MDKYADIDADALAQNIVNNVAELLRRTRPQTNMSTTQTTLSATAVTGPPRVEATATSGSDVDGIEDEVVAQYQSAQSSVDSDATIPMPPSPMAKETSFQETATEPAIPSIKSKVLSAEEKAALKAAEREGKLAASVLMRKRAANPNPKPIRKRKLPFFEPPEGERDFVRLPAVADEAVRVDLVGFGFCSGEVTAMVEQQQSIQDRWKNPNCEEGKMQAARDKEEYQKATRKHRKLLKGYSALYLDGSSNWALFDPLVHTYPPMRGDQPEIVYAPKLFAKFECYQPGNIRIVEINSAEESVRIRSSPPVLKGKRIVYEESGPKIVDDKDEVEVPPKSITPAKKAPVPFKKVQAPVPAPVSAPAPAAKPKGRPGRPRKTAPPPFSSPPPTSPPKENSEPTVAEAAKPTGVQKTKPKPTQTRTNGRKVVQSKSIVIESNSDLSSLEEV